MNIVYKVEQGKITEYSLVSETDKTFKVNFIVNGIEQGGFGTRINKVRDAYLPGTPMRSHNCIATLSHTSAKIEQLMHLDSLINHHHHQMIKYKGIKSGASNKINKSESDKYMIEKISNAVKAHVDNHQCLSDYDIATAVFEAINGDLS